MKNRRYIIQIKEGKLSRLDKMQLESFIRNKLGKTDFTITDMDSTQNQQVKMLAGKLDSDVRNFYEPGENWISIFQIWDDYQLRANVKIVLAELRAKLKKAGFESSEDGSAFKVKRVLREEEK